jgi:hypothetical protein
MVRGSIIAALETAEQWVALNESESAPRQIRHFFAGWWAFLRSDRFLVVQRLVMSELEGFPDLLQFFAEEVVARGRRLIASIVTRGMARGEFRDVDPETAARMLQALAMTHTTWCSRRQFMPVVAAYTDAEVRDQVIDFYLHALRPGVAGAHP